jgi:hypothetical protein
MAKKNGNQPVKYSGPVGGGVLAEQVVPDPNERPSNVSVIEQNDRDASGCGDCERMKPRRCPRHRLNMPVQ